jgi:hypothetical protein
LSQKDPEVGLIFVAIGLIGLITVVLRLVNPVEFLPSDIRSQPGFNESASGLVAVFAGFCLIYGLARLYRSRGK